jgi:hypothetical protein
LWFKSTAVCSDDCGLGLFFCVLITELRRFWTLVSWLSPLSLRDTSLFTDVKNKLSLKQIVWIFSYKHHLPDGFRSAPFCSASTATGVSFLGMEAALARVASRKALSAPISFWKLS